MAPKIGWFDKPGNMRRFLTTFFVLLGALLVAGFLIHPHADFSWETAPNFFAAYGFVAYVVLIVLAKLLRKVLMRPEDYYDN